MFSMNEMSKVHIIRPSTQFSTADMQVTCTTVNFSLSTASELHYPARVIFLASEDGEDFAIKPWDDDCQIGVENSYEFFDTSVKPVPKKITIRDKKFAQALRRTLGWSDKVRRKAYGLFEPDFNLIYFNLSHAEIPTQGGTRRRNALMISDYPKYTNVMHRMKPLVLALPAANAEEVKIGTTCG